MSWDVCTLGDVADFNYGKALPERSRVPGAYPVFGSGGCVGTHSSALVPGPGIVVGRKGTVGATYWVDGDFCPIDTTYFATAKNPETNLKFLYYLIKSLPLSEMNTDAAVPGLNRDNALRVKIRVPNPRLQERIASILSAYDDLIENNRRRIALLEEAARLLYREWFVHFRFPGHEHVKIVDGVPEGWTKMPASQAVAINPRTAWDKDKPITMVPMGALSETIMSCDQVSFEVRPKAAGVKFRNGDTLFARITPCLENGKTGYVNFLDDGEVACGSTEFIVLRESAVSSYYIYLMSREDSFRHNAIVSMVGSSGRQRVQPSCFDKYSVAVPPYAIAQSFDEIVAPAFAQIQRLGQQNMILAKARDLLLPRLMDGRLEV